MYDEQTEDLENPLRCPIKLYDYYLFKWQVTLCSFHLMLSESPSKSYISKSESVSIYSSVDIWVFNTPVQPFLSINSPFLSPALKASRDATMLTT